MEFNARKVPSGLFIFSKPNKAIAFRKFSNIINNRAKLICCLLLEIALRLIENQRTIVMCVQIDCTAILGHSVTLAVYLVAVCCYLILESGVRCLLRYGSSQGVLASENRIRIYKCYQYAYERFTLVLASLDTTIIVSNLRSIPA